MLATRQLIGLLGSPKRVSWGAQGSFKGLGFRGSFKGLGLRVPLRV